MKTKITLLLLLMTSTAHSQQAMPYNAGYQQMNLALSTLTNQWGTPPPTLPMQRMPVNQPQDSAQTRQYYDTLREYQSGYSGDNLANGFCRTVPRLDAYANIVGYKRQCY